MPHIIYLMSLPLESQVEYPLAVEVPTYSIDKCNWCVIAKDMPDIMPKSESLTTDTPAAPAPVSAAQSEPKKILLKMTPHLRLFIILVFMMILYVVIVGYIASYKPHTETR
jgi:hypothetical protein